MLRRSIIMAMLLGMAGAAVERAYSAEITVSKYKYLDMILIEGKIVPGDDDKFLRVAQNVGQAFNSITVVTLSSPGGSVVDALNIGEYIHAKKFVTSVASDTVCASACGMIWLAGTKRLIGSSAKIGFHAAYTVSGDEARESGQANAIVGAYLSKLGFSYEAIAYVTAAAPTDMNWLHPTDAQKVGIQLEVLDDEPTRTAEQPPAAPPPTTAPAVAAPPPAITAEARAQSLILSYYADWSAGGTNVEKLRYYYGGSANFYGSNETTDTIMNEKRKFSARWPIRHYEIKPGTLFAQCSDTCSVSGVVAWDVSSVERSAHSVGTANFVLRIALDGSPTGGLILSENGAVLSARNDSLPTAAPTSQASLETPSAQNGPSAAYLAGRGDRVQYEAWYGALPAGDFQAGAAFWAENRSLKTPPSCHQPAMSQAWQDGCDADRLRLTPSDQRRHAETDYRAGWNSL